MSSNQSVWMLVNPEEIAEAIHEPMIVLDSRLRVKQANPSFYRTFSTSPEETEGRYLYELGDQQWDLPRIHELFDDELPNSPSQDKFEIEHKFPVVGLKSMLWNARAYRRNGSGSNCILLTIEDVTERRRAEKSCKEAEDRLDCLMGKIKDHGIFDLDVEGRVASWTEAAERVTGYAEDEILGKSFNAFFLPEDTSRGIPERELRVAFESGDCEDERWRVRKNGELFWAQEIIVPRHDGGGEFAGYSIILRDITESKRAEERLRQQAEALKESERRKDDFLVVLAHELRNPLAPIRNAVQIMRMAADDAKAVEQARQIIDRQVQQMSRVVEDLLDVSRIIMRQIILRKERVELATIIASAVDASRSLIDVSDHKLTVRLPSEPVVLNGDRARLSQVIVNLLSNAAKYTSHGGFIWLTAEIVGDSVEIRVRDNGIGIHGALLPRVFDMFSQADNAIDRNQGGLGVGLSVVKSLVELHGGWIEAASPGPGQGAEFVVSLPLEEKPLDRRPISHVPEEAAPSAASEVRKVLVVDDNADSAASLAMVLELKGWEVRTAYDGPSAVEAAKTFLPNAILLDIGLPGMSGYEVARVLRQEPSMKGVLLVAQTGWGQEENRLRSQEAGFDHHLVKPVDHGTLEIVLSRLKHSEDHS